MLKVLKKPLFNVMWSLRDSAQDILTFLFFIFLIPTAIVTVTAIASSTIEHLWVIWILVLPFLLILVAIHLLRRNYNTILHRLRPASGFPPQTFPTQMYQFAQQFQSGAPVAFYRGRLILVLLVTLFIILPFLALFVLTEIFTINQNNFFTWANLPTFLLLLPCLSVIYCVHILSYRVFIYTDSCVILKNGKATMFVWEEVDFLWQKITRNYVNGALLTINYVYTIELQDGRRFVFNNTIQKIEELGNYLQRVISNTLLPTLHTSFAKGKRLDFGPIGIDQKNIYFKGTQLSWQQVSDLVVNSGSVWITQKGLQKRRHYVASVSQIPNFLVFLTLVDSARKNFGPPP